MPHLHHGAFGSLGQALVTIMLVFIALAYLRGGMSLRSNSSGRIADWRVCSFVLGLFLIWAALASPLSALDHELLTVHMLKHLLLMTVAPPLIWLGEPMRAWTHCVPRLAWRATGGASYWLGITKIGKALVRPEVGWLAAAAALGVWHIPPIFTLAMQSSPWHFVEQASFLTAGLLFWWPVVQPWPSVPKSDLSMVLYLFFATLPCDILSGFLVFCDRVIYLDYLPSHLFGLSVLGDQQVAAASMWTGVTLVYLVAGSVLTMRLLSNQNVRDAAFPAPDVHARAVTRSGQQGLEAF